MKRYRLVCPGCDGRQVIFGRDCDLCDARGWVPLGRLFLSAIGWLLLAGMAIVSSIVAWS